MSLMSKNKPTKKVDLGDGDYVILQHLSKGVKAEYQRRMSGLYKDIEVLEKLEKSPDQMPADMNLESILGKINEAEYYKLSRAIKSWSVEDPINEESVQELDEDIFNNINNEVNKMNQLSAAEEKN